ncbi:hypothetical protein Hte_011771 [Hypoxylon texense]
MAPFFTNQSCDPFLPPESPCVVGAYIRYAVNATAVSDFQATLEFAKAHNIRLVIRNTAHDFLGKSSGPGALAIWTHYFKSLEVVDYAEAHYSGKALKASAGIQIGDAFQAAHDNGLVIVGGTCSSVGLVGGYTQGGGHGFLASKLGLAADQALEWEVLTTEGSIVKASPSVNPDLYWALSGGGGGTFAVVLSLTVKAYPDQTTASANLTWTNAGITQDIFFEGIRAFAAGLPPLLDAGSASTWLNSNTSFSASPVVGFGMTQKELDTLFAPILDKLQQLNVTYYYSSAEFPTFLDMYTTMASYCETNLFQVGGRLIPRAILLDSLDDFTDALRKISDMNTLVSGVTFNVSKTPDVENAVNPGFREASVSLLVGTRSEDIADQVLMTDTIVPTLSNIIPGGGFSYLNEGNPFEPNWEHVFYGGNYEQLQEIKDKYDPEGILYARTAVGSDRWIERVDGRLCQI